MDKGKTNHFFPEVYLRNIIPAIIIIIIIIVLQLSKNLNQLVLIYISWKKKKEKRFKQRRAAAARVRLVSLQTQAARINLCDHLSLHAHKLTPAAQSASTGISIGLLMIGMGSSSSQTFVSSWFVAAVREMEHTSKPHYPALTGPTGCIKSNGASSVYCFSQRFIYIHSRQSKRRRKFHPKSFLSIWKCEARSVLTITEISASNTATHRPQGGYLSGSDVSLW